MRKGNVFNRVCQSFCLFTGEYSNLLIWGLPSQSPYLNPLPLPNMFKLSHYVAHTFIDKQTVGLRLKGLLVISVPFQIMLQCLIKQVDDLNVTFTENADFYTNIKGSILSSALHTE